MAFPVREALTSEFPENLLGNLPLSRAYSVRNRDHLYRAVIEGHLCKLTLCPEVVTCAECHCHITSFPASPSERVCLCVCGGGTDRCETSSCSHTFFP